MPGRCRRAGGWGLFVRREATPCRPPCPARRGPCPCPDPWPCPSGQGCQLQCICEHRLQGCGGGPNASCVRPVEKAAYAVWAPTLRRPPQRALRATGGEGGERGGLEKGRHWSVPVRGKSQYQRCVMGSEKGRTDFGCADVVSLALRSSPPPPPPETFDLLQQCRSERQGNCDPAYSTYAAYQALPYADKPRAA